MRFEDSAWEYDDFEFEKNTLLRFSLQGERKVLTNKDLVLPDITKENLPITIIGFAAFEGYNLQSIDLSFCVSLEKIEASAFFNNKIKVLNFNNCEELKTISHNAFAGNNIRYLNLSPCLKLKSIGFGAFRDNKLLIDVNVSNCMQLEEIKNNAFTNTAINKIIIGSRKNNIAFTLIKNITEYNLCKIIVSN